MHCAGEGVYPSMQWAGGLYPSMHWVGGCLPGGVSAHGDVCQGGMSAPGGVCPGAGGCLPGGLVSAQGCLPKERGVSDWQTDRCKKHYLAATSRAVIIDKGGNSLLDLADLTELLIVKKTQSPIVPNKIFFLNILQEVPWILTFVFRSIWSFTMRITMVWTVLVKYYWSQTAFLDCLN